MAEADPQKTFNVHDAKSQLSKLIDRARAGEEIIIAKAGEPMVRLVPVGDAPAASRRRKPGQLAHLRAGVPSEIWFEPSLSEDELDRMESGESL